MSTAARARRWTLEEMHALREDGNKYELVDGALWVTPASTDRHETVLARLARLLDPFVEAQGLGLIYRARAVFRVGRTLELEPDLMVRQLHPDRDARWETAPLPALVVEVVSPSSRRRDHGPKRELYMARGIPDYWIVDADHRTVTIVQPGRDPETVAGALTWSPAGAAKPLTFVIARIFQ